MAEGNVEIVERLFEGWGKGDFTIGAESLDPEILFEVRSPFPAAGTLAGPQEISDYLRDFLAQWRRFTVEAVKLRPVGDAVLATVVQRGTGRLSGVPGEAT